MTIIQKGEPMSDLISRKAAIDAICEDWCGTKHCDCKTPFDIEKDEYYHCDGCTDVEVLLRVPAAEPFGSIEHAGIEHPLSDREIIPRLRQIQEQVGGSYAIDRIIEIAMSKQPEPCEDTYGYIAIETLLAFCENSKDHAVTPNDFMRMKRVRKPEPCEDAVSREKVKELAYSQIRSEYSGIALKEQRESMLRIADNVIGLLPSVTPKQRWIPVEEALPEEYGEYFVTWWCEHLKRPFVDILEYEPSYIFDHEKNRFTGEWLYPKDDERFTDGIVIAWKPLEEPYKRKE